MRLSGRTFWSIVSAGAVVAAATWVTSAQSKMTPPGPAVTSQTAVVKRGEYLVKSSGCWDCHTPHREGAEGPEPDMSRWLSGHPADMKLPPPPEPKGPWIVAIAGTSTAWAGPWGVSYTANLTSDRETGLGEWTEQQFIDTMRTGRRQGRGRQILPPMPWPAISNMTDDDLKAMFAYLRAVPPVKNRVPEPVLPSGTPQ
jgi:mono/diheme cytochrome c family protein